MIHDLILRSMTPPTFNDPTQDPHFDNLATAYASPNFNKRKFFWEYLQNLATVISLPWVLLGDFHDMISGDEKMGGLPLNRNRITAFSNCIDTAHGPKFSGASIYVDQ